VSHFHRCAGIVSAQIKAGGATVEDCRQLAELLKLTPFPISEDAHLFAHSLLRLNQPSQARRRTSALEERDWEPSRDRKRRICELLIEELLERPYSLRPYALETDWLGHLLPYVCEKGHLPSVELVTPFRRVLMQAIASAKPGHEVRCSASWKSLLSVIGAISCFYPDNDYLREELRVWRTWPNGGTAEGVLAQLFARTYERAPG
jgi:hypothetical protein